MTQQTAKGLTYPEPGDHTRIWEHVQQLAEDTDLALDGVSDVSETVYAADSPWNDLASAITLEASGPNVTLHLYARASAPRSVISGEVIGTIVDPALRPDRTVYLAAVSVWGTTATPTPLLLAVSTSGTISAISKGDNVQAMRGNATWMVTP